MNIHEYQAKELLKKFGVPIPKGVVTFSVEETLEKAKLLKRIIESIWKIFKNSPNRT
jgi:succinyl-CoA synthetase beta subunit